MPSHIYAQGAVQQVTTACLQMRCILLHARCLRLGRSLVDAVRAAAEGYTC